MATALLKEYRRAHEQKDVDAALRLVYWKGTEPAAKQNFAASFKDDFAMAIDKLEVVPPAPDQLTRYTRNGKTFATNLKVKKALVVHFKPQAGVAQVHNTRYLLGEKDGKYYITTAVPVS